jgi:hypothetical protein
MTQSATPRDDCDVCPQKRSTLGSLEPSTADSQKGAQSAKSRASIVPATEDPAVRMSAFAPIADAVAGTTAHVTGASTAVQVGQGTERGSPADCSHDIAVPYCSAEGVDSLLITLKQVDPELPDASLPQVA